MNVAPLCDDDYVHQSAVTESARETYEFWCLETLASAVDQWTAALSTRQRIEVGHRLGSIGDALRTAAAAELIGADGDTRSAQRALSGAKTSKRGARREARRAAAAAKNPKIADKMASGSLSGEQVDALVDVDNKTDGGVIADDELIDEVAASSADATAKIIDDYVTGNADSDSVQGEHDRQRGLRGVYKHKGRFGLGAITVEGDEPSVDAIYKQIRADANRLYHLDGGRDVALGSHPRSNDQRLFDAVWARLTGNAAPFDLIDADGNPIDTNGEPAADGTATCGTAAGGTAASEPLQSRRTTPAARRPTVVIVASLEKLLGGDLNQAAEQIGVGPIADSVLASYLANSQVGVDLIGALFGAAGEPLWLGRRTRLASDGQYLGLVIRDKGCTLCGAGYEQCQAHHLTPWNAPAAGETDIDKLALLCDQCHHRLHDEDLTLLRDRNTGRWKTRAASPAETPPPGPKRRPQPTQTRPTHATSHPNPPSAHHHKPKRAA